MFYQLSRNDTEKPNILSDGTVNRPTRDAVHPRLERWRRKKLNAALIDHDAGTVYGVFDFLCLRVLSFSYRRSFSRRDGAN